MRAHWAAAELELDCSCELIGSRTGATQTAEFLQLNPKHKIPVLLHRGLVLTESAAILNYLSRLAKDCGGRTLLPDSTGELAVYEEWQSFILMELDAQCLYVIRKHRDLAEIYGEAPGAVTAASKGLLEQMSVVERRLAGRTWLLGEQFSGIDILLATCLEWALAYEFNLDPLLHDYLKNVRSRSAYKKARELNFSISPGA